MFKNAVNPRFYESFISTSLNGHTRGFIIWLNFQFIFYSCNYAVTRQSTRLKRSSENKPETPNKKVGKVKVKSEPGVKNDVKESLSVVTPMDDQKN